MLRPAYPDELGRAQSLLNGHPVPSGAEFLVLVKEHPVERIIAAIPWWKVTDEEEATQLKFNFYSGSAAGLSEESLDEIFATIESVGIREGITAIIPDIPLVKQHPLFEKLTSRGYEIHETQTFLSASGEEVKSFFLKQENDLPPLPTDWRIESIRGHAPETFYPLVHADGSLTPKTFKTFWDGSSRERFEGDFSHLILAGEEVIGLMLATLQGSHGLNIRIESISPEHADQSELISNLLHQAAFQNCPDAFPQSITWSRQTQSSYQQAQAQEPSHTLIKSLF